MIKGAKRRLKSTIEAFVGADASWVLVLRQSDREVSQQTRAYRQPEPAESAAHGCRRVAITKVLQLGSARGAAHHAGLEKAKLST